MVNGTRHNNTGNGKSPVIVGIDPGTTAAVAVLDLDGNLVNTKSAKNFSKDQIIRFIIAQGKPLIVGTDVANAPSLVEGIASNLGAEFSVPGEDLQAAYKEELADAYAYDPPDAHTFDALAAAEYARREYAGKIAKIRRKAQADELAGPEADDVVELVLKGSLPTSQAISEVSKSADQDESDAEQSGSNANKDWRQIAEQRQQENTRLKEKIADLEAYNERLEEQSAAEKESEDTVAEEELRQRNRRINELRQELAEKQSRLEHVEERKNAFREALHRVINDDWLYVPVVDDLADVSTGVVYSDTYRGGDVDDRVDTVVTAEGRQHTPPYRELARRGVQVATVDEANMLDVETGYVINEDQLDDVEEGKQFVEWLEDYKKRQKT